MGQPSISVSIWFPIKAVAQEAKCRQFNRSPSFVQSFPTFGRGFDSHRPLHLSLKTKSLSIPNCCRPQTHVVEYVCRRKFLEGVGDKAHKGNRSMSHFLSHGLICPFQSVSRCPRQI